MVRWMYEQFLDGGKTESEIAKLLNGKGILSDFGRAWTRATVHEVLTNEKYIGNNVYHRTSFKLKRKHVENPPDKWIRVDGAFEGIVSPEKFFKVQGIILARSRKLSDDQMLEKLRAVLKQHGRISGILIDEAEELPSSAAFRNRFGSLVTAYKLIGYEPEIDYSFIEVNRRLRKEHPQIVGSVITEIAKLGGLAEWQEDAGLLCLNRELQVSIVLCRHQTTLAGSSRWLIRLDESNKPDLTVAARMNPDNSSIHDYYLLPGIDMTWEKLRLAEANGIYLDAYRFETLEYFLAMAKRVELQEAA